MQPMLRARVLRSPLPATGEAAPFGAPVPAGSDVAFAATQETVGVPDRIRRRLVRPRRRRHRASGLDSRPPHGLLLSGGLAGVVVGFAAFAALVGWGIASFALPLFAMGAIVAGAWTAYER